MCKTVVDQTGRWLGSANELAEFGWIVTPADVGFDYDEFDPDSCLCSVDVEAVLDRHGIPHHSDDGGGFIILGDAP